MLDYENISKINIEVYLVHDIYFRCICYNRSLDCRILVTYCEDKSYSISLLFNYSNFIEIGIDTNEINKRKEYINKIENLFYSSNLFLYGFSGVETYPVYIEKNCEFHVFPLTNCYFSKLIIDTEIMNIIKDIDKNLINNVYAKNIIIGHHFNVNNLLPIMVTFFILYK